MVGSGGGRERFVGGYASTAWGGWEVAVVVDSSGTGETDGLRLVPRRDEGPQVGERGEIGADVEVDPVASGCEGGCEDDVEQGSAAGCDGSFAEVSVSCGDSGDFFVGARGEDGPAWDIFLPCSSSILIDFPERLRRSQLSTKVMMVLSSKKQIKTAHKGPSVSRLPKNLTRSNMFKKEPDFLAVLRFKLCCALRCSSSQHHHT